MMLIFGTITFNTNHVASCKWNVIYTTQVPSWPDLNRLNCIRGRRNPMIRERFRTTRSIDCGVHIFWVLSLVEKLGWGDRAAEWRSTRFQTTSACDAVNKENKFPSITSVSWNPSPGTISVHEIQYSKCISSVLWSLQILLSTLS